MTSKTGTMIRNILVAIAVCAMLAESSALIVSRSRRSADTLPVKKVLCTFEMVNSWRYGRQYTCFVNHSIDDEAYVLESELDTAVERFDISDKKEVKYLPRHVGEKFPNLKGFWAHGCGLTVLLDYFFEGMRNLQVLVLYENKITTIESNAFKDLISLKSLDLADNIIETLDEKLFAALVNLKSINFYNNKIKFLNPATFTIPGGQLTSVSLMSNVCINGLYEESHLLHNLDQLEADLGAKCTSS